LPVLVAVASVAVAEHAAMANMRVIVAIAMIGDAQRRADLISLIFGWRMCKSRWLTSFAHLTEAAANPFHRGLSPVAGSAHMDVLMARWNESGPPTVKYLNAL